MHKDMFATLVALVGISMAGVAVSQNLVDPISDQTDLKSYSPHLGRSVAEMNYRTDIVRHALDRDPVLAATSQAYQDKYGITSYQTRQLDYQHRRSGWRVVDMAPPTGLHPAVPMDHSHAVSGEIVGLQPVPEGLPAGSVEVVGPELAQYRVNPGIRLYRAPSGKFYYVKDPTAPGSLGADVVASKAPSGSVVVDPASVGVTSVTDGFVLVRGPDGRLYLAPASAHM